MSLPQFVFQAYLYLTFIYFSHLRPTCPEKVTIKNLCNYLPSNQSLNKDDPDNLGKRCEMPYYEKLISVNNVTESTSRPSAMDFILIKAMGFCKSVNYTMYK